MKNILLSSILLLSVAYANQLTPQEHMSIHNYNHHPLVELKNRRQMSNLSHLNEDDVKDITIKETDERASYIKLTHQGNYLIYMVRTKNYLLIVNALDGSVIKKERVS